jgi:predicted ATPase
MLQEFGAAMKRSAASLKKFGEVFQAPKTGTAKQKVRKILRHKGTLDHVLNFGSKPWHWRIVKKRGLTIVRTMRWKDFTTEIDWAKFPKNLESEEMKNRRAELYWELREKFNG